MNTWMLLVHYRLKVGQGRAFLQALESSGLPEKVRREEGCIRYAYYLAEDEKEILLLEEWAGEEQQQAHLRQPHMQALGRLKAHPRRNLFLPLPPKKKRSPLSAAPPR